MVPRSFPARAALCCALALLPLLAPPLFAQHLPIHPGHWSLPLVFGDPDSEAVHAVLLRGDTLSHHQVHSRVLWWGDEGVPSFEGGLLDWNPRSEDPDSVALHNLSRTALAAPPVNLFCAGHAHLPSGDLLVSGGHEHLNVGITASTLFHWATSSWSAGDTLAQRHWYPTNTALADGTLLTMAGDMYTQMIYYGGREEGGTTLRDSVDRYDLVMNGQWDPPIKPVDPAINQAPIAREGHTLSSQDFGSKFLFGGKQADGTYLNDAWRLDNLDTDAEQSFTWKRLTTNGAFGSPAQRWHHAAVSVNDTMYLFGGEALDGLRNDLWVLSKSQNAWLWSPLTPQNPTLAPSPRSGHSAVFLEPNRMVVIYGGANAGSVLADSVWVLSLRGSPPLWQRPVVVSATKPAARTLQALVATPHPASHRGASWSQAYLFGGQRADSLSHELWRLWVSAAGDSVDWERVSTTGTPPMRRRQATLGFESQNERLHLFGGDSAGVYERHAWDLDVYPGDSGQPDYLAWRPGTEPRLGLTGQAGFWSTRTLAARFPEFYDPARQASNKWTLGRHPKLMPFYPFMFVDTLGDVLTLGPNNVPSPTWRLQLSDSTWQQFPASNDTLDGSSAVMYRPGYAMKSGYKFRSPALGSTESISRADDAWVPSLNPMLYGRLEHNLTALPSGEVLATGGTRLAGNLEPVYQPELWDPDTSAGGHRGFWYGGAGVNALAPSTRTRDYHSTALLLPDGRVLHGGGNTVGDDMRSLDLYSPPYLFNADGARATRPELRGVQESIAWGDTFRVSCPDTVVQGVLLRAGAVTHAFNQDQRWVPLELVSAGPPCYTFRAPASGAIAPPGDYLLFVLNARKVPAVAQWVNLGSTLSTWNTCDADAPEDASIVKLCSHGNALDLEWLAPHQNGTAHNGGPVQGYELRYREGQGMANESEFLQYGTLVEDVSGPSQPDSGVYDYATATGLTPMTRYYFRLMYKDAAGRWRNWTLSTQRSFVTRYEDCGDGLMAGGGSESEGFAARRASEEGSLASPLWGVGNSLLDGIGPDRVGLDRCRLDPGPLTWDSLVAVRLVAPTHHGMALSRAGLVALDHASGVSAFATTGGYLLGSRQPAQAVHHGAEDLTASLTSGTGTFSGQLGDTLRVSLSGSAAAVLLEAQGPNRVLAPDSSGILVQVLEGATWRTLARHVPRESYDRFVLDSAGAELRLVFLGDHALRYVGEVSRDTAVAAPQAATLRRAERNGVAVSDSAGYLLAALDTLVLGFAAPAPAEGETRDWFLEAEGSMASTGAASPARLAPTTVPLPTCFALAQNRPNPFTGGTTFRFALPLASEVRLEIFDLQGRRVATPLRGRHAAGVHEMAWDRRSAGGRRLEAGIYLYRLSAGRLHAERKMVLMP